MTKLGKINFNDYDSDETIGSSKYTSPSINHHKVITTVLNKNKSKTIKLDCNEGTSYDKDKYEKCNIDSLDSESENSNSQFDIRNKYKIGDCNIITYDNSKDHCNRKKRKDHVEQGQPLATDLSDQGQPLATDQDKPLATDQVDQGKPENSRSLEEPLDDNNSLSSLFNISDHIESSKSHINTNFYDGYKVHKCNDNICDTGPSLGNNLYKKIKDINLCEGNICNFDQLDIVAKKLKTISDSLKTISHLVQYYLQMLEQVKIDVSQCDISHSINSCIETTVSLSSYIKAEIQKNKTFVLDDKYNNRDGYYLTNGLTKVYYIEKVKFSLLKSGEFIFVIYEEKKGLKEYELGNEYSDVTFEGDLYTMIDTAKEKGIHFNKYIQNKYMKVTSIFNLHLIYLNKYKI